jgi:hypothetical protein
VSEKLLFTQFITFAKSRDFCNTVHCGQILFRLFNALLKDLPPTSVTGKNFSN